MWKVKVNNEYYARGYTPVNIVFVKDKKFARSFNTEDEASNFAKKLFKFNKEINVEIVK